MLLRNTTPMTKNALIMLSFSGGWSSHGIFKNNCNHYTLVKNDRTCVVLLLHKLFNIQKAQHPQIFALISDDIFLVALLLQCKQAAYLILP